MTTLIQVDGRKRVSLGKLAQHDQYVVTEEPSGRLIFEPAVVLTVSERNFLEDTELVQALERSHATRNERQDPAHRPSRTTAVA